MSMTRAIIQMNSTIYRACVAEDEARKQIYALEDAFLREAGEKPPAWSLVARRISYAQIHQIVTVIAVLSGSAFGLAFGYYFMDALS